MHEPSSVPELTLRTADGQTFRFTRPFHVGRSDACDVAIDDHHISRKHLLVEWRGGQWTFTDLQSSNGVFRRGARVQTGTVDGLCVLNLGGADGPTVSLEVDDVEPTIVIRLPSQPARGTSRLLPGDDAQHIKDKYFGSSRSDEKVGEHTMVIRKAYAEVRKQQKRFFAGVVAALVMIVVATAGYALYAHLKLRQQQDQIETFFYHAKALEVTVAQLEIRFAASESADDRDLLRRSRADLRQSEEAYNSFLAGITVRGRPLSQEEQLILRVTKRFGECELIAPPEYLDKVKEYIAKWKSTKRFSRAIEVAQERGYVEPIARAFIEQELPPHYFYLALQESDFDPHITGPATRYGFAKGMWQFIPETGQRFGLAIGPRAKVSGYDPQDERFDWEKATRAAARYIKDIYATDAQASGLLVMASYNWGEHRIIDRIKRMPNNPRDRNFWKLLAEHRIPDQTYDYVFSIVSAAVIGENPRLFGFPFDDPLGGDARPSTTAASARARTTDAIDVASR